MRTRAALLLAAFAVVSHAGALFGQGFQGGLRGSIKDAGGVVPGVEVTLTNEKTNISRTTVTNDRGEFVFANVEPGSYSVKAALTGYKTIDRKEIPIGTQQFITLDLTLEVGALEENIVVTGQSPVIDTSNASQGTVLDSAALQTLPAPGRNAFMIGTTVPTVIPTGDTQFNRQQDQTNASLLSLGGGPRRGNNYTLDGVPITDLRNRASANPSIEALEDVKVQVHTYDAEMARTGGGVFNTTLKSGSNSFRGTGFYQTRPIWGQTNNYFAQIAHDVALTNGDTVTASKNDKPDSPYYLGGGGVGGPIVKNRTFFWFATESYTDVQTRNAAELMPTARERAGDFSQTTRSGQPVIIYDPLTKQPFQNNVIPSNRINPVAANMLKYLPLPDGEVDNGTANYNRVSKIKSKWTQEYTAKMEHKFSDRVSLTGFYLYNRSNEPCANYFGTADQTEPNRFADPFDYILVRRPQIVALNNTWVVSDSSVLALRFGWTKFPDNNTLTADFDPATLGFAQNFLNQITYQKFPNVRIRGYDLFAAQTLGAINPTQINWKSWSSNATYSKFVGTHSMKFGGDFRKIGVDTYIPGDGIGFFDFDTDTTSSSGTATGGSTNGNSVASFLLGYPSGDPNRVSRLSVSTPLNLFTYYYGGYAQDDWRVTSKVTLNFGVRVEHEDGMHELNNNFTVGFDKATGVLPGLTVPADPLAGVAAHGVAGGLMYAGVNGNGTTQGNPQKLKWSPRVGAVYSVDAKTVIRSGYGMYWAPYNYPIPSTTNSNYGQVGYTNNTNSPQTSPVPTVSLTNPFPSGIVPPSGNSRGLLSGAGTSISYVDQDSTATRVQQWSVDLQRELPGQMAVTVSYVGSRGDHLALGGSNDTAVNINQLDPKYLSLGSALTQQVTNPFYQNSAFAGTALGSSPTTTRGQLLRPYPQFLDINARHVLEGKSTYSAAVVEWSKRMAHGLGGRVSYTYSVLKDNQVGEGNTYVAGGNNPINAYNYIPSAPACTTTNFAACYNPDADFTYSLLDVPHRVIIAPMFELPFGKGKKWGANSGLVNVIAGGWLITTAINIQSGFPLSVIQTDRTGLLGGGVNRPNLVSGVDLATPGSFEDRQASADHPSARWLNPAAFSLAPDFTFGNAPRTITGLRSPMQHNVDASFAKDFRFGAKAVQVRAEILNLLNDPLVSALNGRNLFAPGSATFGGTAVQRGFMRITQLMFRFSF